MKSVIVAVFCAAASAALAQVAPDPGLKRQIFQIKAIDDHSHPPRLVAAGETDDEFDALPCDPLEPAPVPAKVRPQNAQFDRFGPRSDRLKPQHTLAVVPSRGIAFPGGRHLGGSTVSNERANCLEVVA